MLEGLAAPARLGAAYVLTAVSPCALHPQSKLPLDHLYHYDSMGTGVNV